MDKKQVVFPGDELGTSEEFISGEGTYESDGKIYATSVGTLEVDITTRYAKIKSLTSTPVLLKVGDIVFGVIEDIRSSMVFVTVKRVMGIDRGISSERQGSIHVSKISQHFINDIGRAFWIGDIIKAKVIQVDPAVQLSTEGVDLGVVKSFCRICQRPLIKKNQDLFCNKCERIWQKKITDDYGKGTV